MPCRTFCSLVRILIGILDRYWLILGDRLTDSTYMHIMYFISYGAWDENQTIINWLDLGWHYQPSGNFGLMAAMTMPLQTPAASIFCQFSVFSPIEYRSSDIWSVHLSFGRPLKVSSSKTREFQYRFILIIILIIKVHFVPSTAEHKLSYSSGQKTTPF